MKSSIVSGSVGGCVCANGQDFLKEVRFGAVMVFGDSSYETTDE